ncbi:hypothetical protein BKA62DRAFT_818775 [Auriculariales sp. MPI-PUGE-AT-0066]|nr:hypothetical protein BKA62DRAFT_818775 [Auriculariales sp. MPI-PUGE-AT-0066]
MSRSASLLLPVMFLWTKQPNPLVAYLSTEDELESAIAAIHSSPSVATQLRDFVWGELPMWNLRSSGPSQVANALSLCTNLSRLSIVHKNSRTDPFGNIADALGPPSPPAWPVLHKITLLFPSGSIAAQPSSLQRILAHAPAVDYLAMDMELPVFDVEQTVKRGALPAAALKSLFGGWPAFEGLLALCDVPSHNDCGLRQVEHVHVLRELIVIYPECHAFERILQKLQQSSSGCPSFTNIKSFNTNTSQKASEMGILLQHQIIQY